MAIRSYSYIKKLLGDRTYEEFRGYAKTNIPIATIILVVLLVISQFVHWRIVSCLLNLALGTSLIFIAYILGVILLLDFGVDVEMKEDWDGRLSLPEVMPSNFKKLYGHIPYSSLVLPLYTSVTSIERTILLNVKHS